MMALAEVCGVVGTYACRKKYMRFKWQGLKSTNVIQSHARHFVFFQKFSRAGRLEFANHGQTSEPNVFVARVSSSRFVFIVNKIYSGGYSFPTGVGHVSPCSNFDTL